MLLLRVRQTVTYICRRNWSNVHSSFYFMIRFPDFSVNVCCNNFVTVMEHVDGANVKLSLDCIVTIASV